MVESNQEITIAEEAVPMICEGMDFKGMNLKPEEGYLLSRLDGHINVATLLQASGLGAEPTMSILSALYAQGIIIFHDHHQAKPETPPAPPDQPPTAAKAHPVLELPALQKALAKPLPRGDELIAIVDSVFVNLEHLTYYELLGLFRKANDADIKKAYFKRTKSFHPDRFFRHADKDLKNKLQEIFKQLNQGYRALLDPEDRKTYDATLKEEEIQPGPAPVETAAPSSRTRVVKGGGSPWKKVRVPPREIQERIKARPLEPEKAAFTGPKLKIAWKDQKKPSGLLKKIEEIKTREVQGQLAQSEKFFKGAMFEKNKGNFKAARTNLKLALQYMPNYKKYVDALAELERDEARFKAEAEFKAGQAAAKAGDLEEATRRLREAKNLGFESAEFYHSLAEILMKKERNYERAKVNCLKAIEMDPNVAVYHLCLARAYQGLGQKPAAIQQLERVLKMDPKHKEAAKELKSLKKG